MLIQSLFFVLFTTVLMSCFALSTVSRIHASAEHRMQMLALAAADVAVERARETAETAMRAASGAASPSTSLTAFSDGADGTGLLTLHNSIDAPTDLSADPPIASASCSAHDATEQCNIEVGSGVGERRVWETIDIRSLSAAEPVNLRRHVLLRLLRAAPYATVVAVRDDGTSGTRLLGDASGFPNMRVKAYEPCRFVSSKNAAMATAGRNWANWQGGNPGPARQNQCDTGAGEASRYANAAQPAVDRLSSSWGH
jgi:hypothetical protein